MLKPHHLDLDDNPCHLCEEAELDLAAAYEGGAEVEPTQHIGTCPECGRHGRRYSIEYPDTGVFFFTLVVPQ